MGSSHSGAIPPERQSHQPDVRDVIDVGDRKDRAEGRIPWHDEIRTIASMNAVSFVQAMLDTDGLSDTANSAIEDVIGEATDKLDEAAAERKIHQLLVECGARGPEWELVVDRIARYANAVLDAWLRTGAIYGELGKRRIRVEASERQRIRLAFNKDLRDEILATTVVNALEALQKDIRHGTGWDPGKGAKLTTYFLRGCLFHFKTAFECHLRSERANLQNHAGPSDLDPLNELHYDSLCDTGLGADPADLVSEQDSIRRHLAPLNEQERQIVYWHTAGYTHAEIAQLLDTTAKAIERKWARLRAKHQWIANLSSRRS